MRQVDIDYVDGTQETIVVEDYTVHENCLQLLTYIEDNSEYRYIPLMRIKECRARRCK